MVERAKEVAPSGTGPIVNSVSPDRSSRQRCCTAFWCTWVLLLTFASASRFLASLAWPIDLLANVSYIAAVPAALTCIGALAARRGRLAALSLAAAITAVWPVRSMLLPPRAPAAAAVAPADRHFVRVLVSNVQGSKSALDNLIPILVREKPDAAAVIEVLPGLEGYLADNSEIREVLPFVVGPERGMTWRDMLLSRYVLHRLRFDGDFERYKFVYAYRRSCFVEKPEGRFLFTAAHPPSPRDATAWARGNELTALLAEVSRAHLLPSGVPVVVGGDFNATASGHRHHIMLDQSGLRASDVLGGLAGTWPAAWPAPLRLTIDRVWASAEIEFVARQVLEDIGSDHRPILVTLSLPRADGR